MNLTFNGIEMDVAKIELTLKSNNPQAVQTQIYAFRDEIGNQGGWVEAIGGIIRERGGIYSNLIIARDPAL